MKKIFFGFAFLFLAVNIVAQSEGFIHDGGLTIKTTSDFYNLQGRDIQSTSAFLKENNINGSPFLNDDFILGYIITVDNVKYDNIPLRYNIYNNEIEFEKEEAIFALGNPVNYAEISIGSQVFIYSAIENNKKDNEHRFAYFEMMNSKNDLLLLKRFGVLFNNPVPSQGYVEAKPAAFKKTPERFYLKFDNAPAQEVRNLKFTLLLFGERSNEIEDFIKADKLKLRKLEDMLQIVNYYNSH